jgi:rod shape-determining protein MreD
VRAAAIIAAVAMALALQTTVASLVPRGTAVPDLVLIVVVYIALTTGPVTGVLLGSAAGVAQDALSGGIIGIGGLAKAVAGYVTGVLGTQFILTAPFSRLLAFILATVLHAVVFVGLYSLLDLRQFPDPYRTVVTEAGVNAVLGVVAAHLVESIPGFRERRRARRVRH